MGVSYVEPGAAVSINNALVAAQAEALAAEEAVLGNITQLVSEHAYELEALLHGVADLDAARARSRCAATCRNSYFLQFAYISVHFSVPKLVPVT